MKLFLSIVLAILFSLPLSAQENGLKAGPMLGAVEMREVKIWLQTNAKATVQIEFKQSDVNQVRFSKTYRSTAANYFTNTLILDSLEPGLNYVYRIHLNGQALSNDWPYQFSTQELFQFRTDPPSFTFAMGSCSYKNEEQYDRPGKPYGAGQEIFNLINKARPDFMLWLGDNTYLREADWYSKTGIYHRYSYSRADENLQELLSNAAHYAIWDDHDYGPNDSHRSYRDKAYTYEAFKDFWANPSYGENGKGIYTQFTWADCDFFLLDNRTFRYPNERSKEKKAGILGEEQIQWLLDGLSSSKAPFKFICVGGQILNTGAVYENHAIYKRERKKILKAIAKMKIEGVVFLTGDRHHSALSAYKPCFAPKMYDLTVSPLSSKAYEPREKNKNLLEETLVVDQNFGLISVSGPRKARELTITIITKDGEVAWQRKMQKSDF